MSEFHKREEQLEQMKCTSCGGLGRQDDAAPGDIYVRDWECPVCKGRGIDPKMEKKTPKLASLVRQSNLQRKAEKMEREKMEKPKATKSILDDPERLINKIKSGKIMILRRPPWLCAYCNTKSVTTFELVEDSAKGDSMKAVCSTCKRPMIVFLDIMRPEPADGEFKLSKSLKDATIEEMLAEIGHRQNEVMHDVSVVCAAGLKEIGIDLVVMMTEIAPGHWDPVIERKDGKKESLFGIYAHRDSIFPAQIMLGERAYTCHETNQLKTKAANFLKKPEIVDFLKKWASGAI